MSAGLEAYGAASVEVDGTVSTGPGGGLAAAFERIGRRPLLAALTPGVERIRLVDGDLSVEVVREGAGARLRVAFGGRVAVDEPVTPPVASGPAFTPDPGARVGAEALADPTIGLVAVDEGGAIGWYARGSHGPGPGALPLRGVVPPVDPGALGSAAFRASHGVRYAYIAGAMAGGIGSAAIVIAMAKAGLIGFFGAGGLPEPAVEAALDEVSRTVGDAGAWGFNLLHNPTEPRVEEHTVDLYLKYGVRRVSASAYMALTAAVVRYRTAGIHRGPGGIVCPNHVFAKISRPEVAEKFLRPAPEAILRQLVESGAITADQAALAAQVPVAEDVTGEADSGGHTDHRPLVVLLPILQRLRDRVHAELKYPVRPRIGAAGGLGTPESLWGAFAMGADYVLTGSVNQAAREAGTSDAVKQMLADAAFTDVASGPAPDMFELGASVQVLARGTMYAQRAQRLYDLYRRHASIEELPADERARIEKQLFGRDLDEVWAGTREYWLGRDPEQVARAEREPRHRMALTFRWYLGMTSRWPKTGDADRKRDYQVWCGPAMGGFNDWARGGPLEPVGARTVVGIAEALMAGAAVEARRSMARSLGLL